VIYLEEISDNSDKNDIINGIKFMGFDQIRINRQMSQITKTDIKQVYTTRETADLLGVSLRTIQLWVESGILKAWKTAGGHRRISRESVNALLNERNGALSINTSAKQYKLLVIEDDTDLLELYRLHIQLWNLPIQVLTAVNGYEGLIKIGRELPDIIIVDLILPNMNGFELINTLLENNEYKNIGIIVVTSLSDEEIEKMGGIDESIIQLKKPVSFERLQQLISQRINNKNAHTLASA
jgi:excisionase family DNA binding protein